MGRRKRGKRQGRGKITVDGVLSGRQRPGAEDLIRLIADVNPTGEALPSNAMQKRYAQKTQLQGLLIERYGDAFKVTRDAENQDVVLLIHRHLGLDACHAPIDTLGTDARAWVQRQLDIQEAEADDGAASPAAREPAPRRHSTDHASAPEDEDELGALSVPDGAARPGTGGHQCLRLRAGEGVLRNRARSLWGPDRGRLGAHVAAGGIPRALW